MSGYSMMRRRRGLAAGAAACVVVGVACYGPTEVRLEISTDLPCHAATEAGAPSSAPVHTFVRVGGAVDAPIVADTTACGDHLTADGFNDIGSIVLVPSGDRSAHVTVQVSATADGSNPDVCGRPDTPPLVQAQCIVARRTFAFIKHTSRSLPIRLYASCKGQVCATTETCNRSGQCESATVSDDTGCIASEPNCNATLPGFDAGTTDAAVDAPAVDAADATTRQPCTAADGTNVLATGGATDLMAVNSKELFYVVPGPTFNGARVAVIDTQDPKDPTTLFTVQTGLGVATAIAADELGVWAASSAQVVRYDLAAKTSTAFEITDTMSLAATTALDAPGTVPMTKAYAATAVVSPQGGPGTGAVYELLTDGRSKSAFASPGTSIVATNRSVPTLFMFAPQEFNGPLLWRGQPHLPFPSPLNVATPFTGMATDDAFVFFAAGASINRIDAKESLPTVLFNTSTPGRVAVDQTSVFFEQKGADSAIFRGSKLVPAGGGLVPTERVATGFTDVRGLVVDAACVYFWSTTSAGVETLNVFPKTRTVVGGPVTTIHTP